MIVTRNEALTGLKPGVTRKIDLIQSTLLLRSVYSTKCLASSDSICFNPNAKACGSSRNRNRNGFTLGEVLVTIVIIGLVMTPVFVLESASYRSITSWSERLDRFMAGTLFMTQTGIAKEKEATSEAKKTSQNPKMDMQYKMTEMPKESSLKNTKDLYLERVTLKWQAGKKKEEEVIVMVHHRPDVKKKK